MLAIYVPANGKGLALDRVTCRLPIICAAILSHETSSETNRRSYPSLCVWMVPGTYSEEA